MSIREEFKKKWKWYHLFSWTTPPPIPTCDQVRWKFKLKRKKNIYCTNNDTYFSHFWACLRPRPESIFKMPVPLSFCQLLRYQRQYGWSFAWNYLQYLAFTKLGVNTKLVFGRTWKRQRVFEQWKITKDKTAAGC